MKLKPCPFCGDKVDIAEFRWHDDQPKWIVHHGENPICPLKGISLKGVHSKEKAIEIWNMRIK